MLIATRCPHGRRRRVHHAGDAVDHHQRVHRAPGARPRRSAIWAGVSALGIGIGPITGGFLLDALLVGLGLPRQRADRRSPAWSSATSWSPSPGTESAPRLDPVGRRAVDRRAGALLWAVIEAPAHGVDVAADPRRLRGRRRCSSPRSSCGSCARDHPMLDLRLLREPPVLARRAVRSRSCSSPCSARCSCSPSTCSPVLGYSTVKAGAVLLPQAAVIMIFAPLSSIWVEQARQQGRGRHRPVVVIACDGVLRPPRRASTSMAVVIAGHDGARPRDGQRHGALPPTRSWDRCPGPRPASARR